MRTLVHLSDLHFGRTDPEIIQPLVDTIHNIAPHVVVVSGDLTQRARSVEFMEARRFLDALPQPQIIVPGNHDVPLHDIFSRFTTPFSKYRRFISENTEPIYEDDEIAVVGINTARAMTFKNGRINQDQIEHIRKRLQTLDQTMIKIVVTHHPFDLPVQYGKKALVGRAPLAMETLADCGADILLAGHMHATHTSGTEARYAIPGYSALAVQAGTATSTRGRGEMNSFNVLRVSASIIEIERHEWNPASKAFSMVDMEAYVPSETSDGKKPHWISLQGKSR